MPGGRRGSRATYMSMAVWQLCIVLRGHLEQTTIPFFPPALNIILASRSDSLRTMEAQSEERPSFTSYWRKTKDESAARELTFVQSDPSLSSSKAPGQAHEPGQASKDKRRVQVRKAQVAHRQRKAKYVEQLEADIASIRDRISHAESAREVLRDENEAIRARLSAAAAAAAAASAYNQAPAPGMHLFYMPPYLHSNLQYQEPGLDPGFGMDHYDTMSLNIDSSLDTYPPHYLSEPSPFASSGFGSSLGSPRCLAGSGGSSPYPCLSGM
ncbi:hypothetical protein DHEL01_v209237 [Diaporthe helianthi]|uniref:BZIP domain-containing protein n=1 Tax=Diaporthe helianthi TaxID=158607 RepID=A0A2P5HQ66_DIAHE|nr:hypothetical protein DHEL01_v209237 [Diaporthe helianthi]